MKINPVSTVFALLQVSGASLCRSKSWAEILSRKYMIECTSTPHRSHGNAYYETALPHPYKIIHYDEGEGYNPDEMSWVNRGYEDMASRPNRLRVYLDEGNRVDSVKCG